MGSEVPNPADSAANPAGLRFGAAIGLIERRPIPLPFDKLMVEFWCGSYSA